MGDVDDDDIRRVMTLCLRHRNFKTLESIDSGYKIEKSNRVFGIEATSEETNESCTINGAAGQPKGHFR